MKKMSTAFVLLILLAIFSAEAVAIEGDINGDGKIGLEEAIYALQVTAGIRDQGVVFPPGCSTLFDPATGTLAIGNIPDTIPSYQENSVVKFVGDKIGWGPEQGIETSVINGFYISTSLSDIAFSDGVSRFGVIAIHSDQSVTFLNTFTWCSEDKKLIKITDDSCPVGAGDPVMAVYFDPVSGQYVYVPDGEPVICRDMNGDPLQ